MGDLDWICQDFYEDLYTYKDISEDALTMLLKEDLAILTNVMNESKSKRLGEEDWPSGHLNGQRKGVRRRWYIGGILKKNGTS